MTKKLHNSAPGNVTDPDADLIPRIKRGDQQAFEILVSRHIDSLTRLAAHMLGDPFLAEDVTQSVFLKSWNMLPEWQPGKAKLISWMRKVATHQCLDILRRKSHLYTDNLPEQIDDKALSPLQHLEQNEEARRVNKALSTLEPHQRAVISLAYYNELPQREAAEIMDLTVSAYESLLRRTRKALKMILLDNDFPTDSQSSDNLYASNYSNEGDTQ